MGQISFNAYEQKHETAVNGAHQISYFALKNDGDEALVRIMHDSTADFDMCVVHTMIGDNGRIKKISCLRSAGEPFEKCPLCQAGNKVSSRIYIHLIQYSVDQANNVIATPLIWDRSASYSMTLRDYINEYGPLSDNLFKIKRSGAKGARDTTYNITYCRPEMYPASRYPKDTKAFQNYTAVGNAVIDMSFEDMQKLATPAATSATAPAYQMKSQPAAPVYQAAPAVAAPVYQPKAPTVSAPTYATAPVYARPQQAAPIAESAEPLPFTPQEEAPASEGVYKGPVNTFNAGFRPKRTYTTLQ